MFQGQVQSVKLPAPFRGMDTTSSDNPEYAKYLQNMLITSNNTCTVRYGTRLIAEHEFDENRIFRSQIAVMSHFGVGGTSEKIVYQNYLTVFPEIVVADNVILEEVEGVNNVTKVTVDITQLSDERKSYYKKVIFDGVFVYIRQATRSSGLDITNVLHEDDSFSFNIAFELEFFDRTLEIDPADRRNNFDLFLERGSLYKLEEASFNNIPLIDDLDPNVIVSHVNYQGKLLIANGVDPIYCYDGETIKELKGDAPVLIDGAVTVNDAVLTFEIPSFFQAEMEKYIVANDSILTLISPNDTKEIQLLAINYVAVPNTEKVRVTITLAENAQAGVRSILYKKTLPHFNFLTVAKDRLWALAEGRSYKNKFRPTDIAMKVYYATKRQSVDGWFDQKTGEIDFIDLSAKSPVPDNLEIIVQFQGKVLFIGRDTTQIWTGDDPTADDDGRNITLPEFKHERTLAVGVIQKSLFAEIPNDFVFLSRYGIVSASSLNDSQAMAISYNFANGVDQHLKDQLEFIQTDRDYRNLRAFLYPYGRFVGFKLKYNCLIYQLSQIGSWTIFSENFADSRSIFYDPVSQDLFLGMDDGILLAYADKAQTRSYEDYGVGDITWRIHYSWIYPQTTWNNESTFIACRSLEPTEVNIQVYTDYNDSENFEESIEVDQAGSLYDYARFGLDTYSYRNGSFPYEVQRFQADSIMIVVSGSSSKEFIFDKLILAGGINNAN